MKPIDWSFLPSLQAGQEPIVLDEMGEFEAGDGARLTLFPFHLLVKFPTPQREGHMLLSLEALFKAIGEMNQKIGS